MWEHVRLIVTLIKELILEVFSNSDDYFAFKIIKEESSFGGLTENLYGRGLNFRTAEVFLGKKTVI